MIDRSVLPKALTSYDFLKTFAVIVMVIDHLGAYFFPEEAWLRAVGRLCVPAWIFLIGYARGRDLSLKLLLGGGILVVANVFVGMPVLPLNILMTIALVRVFLDPVLAHFMKSKTHLWWGSAALFLLALPTYIFAEYGTQALILAVYGYYVRHRKETKDPDIVSYYMIFALVTFVLIQMLTFNFTFEQRIFMGLGSWGVFLTLYFFSARTYVVLTEKTPRFLVWFMQLCGRKTLEIYVIHLLFFKALALYLGMEGYAFLGGFEDGFWEGMGLVL